MNETNQAPATGGTKLSTIFMVVLGLHIVVIVVISAFYFMKGRSHPEMADTTQAPADAIPALASDAAPASAAAGTEPAVETESAPIISSQMIDSMAGNEAASPMPATNDPVWSNTSTNTASAPEAEASQNDLVSPHEFQTPPARLVMEPRTLPAPASSVTRKAPVAKPAAVQPVVAKAPAPAPKSAKASTYSVASGDTLSKIARKNGTTVAKLKQANGLTSDALKIGQSLKIPGAAAAKTAPEAVASAAPAKPAAPSAPATAAKPAASAPAVASATSTPAPVKPAAATVASATPAKPQAKPAEPAPAASSSAKSTSYAVVAGDNLTKIAKRNNTTVAKLKQANGLTADSLKVGQILKIPGTAATKAAPKQPSSVREANASLPEKKPFRDPVITMDMVQL